jgi:hypothetical protein
MGDVAEVSAAIISRTVTRNNIFSRKSRQFYVKPCRTLRRKAAIRNNLQRFTTPNFTKEFPQRLLRSRRVSVRILLKVDFLMDGKDRKPECFCRFKGKVSNDKLG